LLKNSQVPIAFDHFLGQPEPGKHRLEKIMKTLTRIQARINSMQNEDGATAVEYGLIVTLIAIAVIGGATAVGLALNGTFNGVAGDLGAVVGG